MSNVISLPYQLCKTLACALYEMQAISNVDPLYLPDTTLNYKYNVKPTVIPTSQPKIAYFGIGTRGFKNIDDGNLSAPFIPSAKNLDLYSPLPFRVVPIEADLTLEERAIYRMRVLKTVNGNQYWCYYLKKISFIDNRVKIIKTNLTTNEETTLDGLDPINLTPTPTDTSAEGITTSTEQISVALSASVQITGKEVIEATNVLQNGNLLKAVISEIGIYTCEDQDTQLSDGVGGSFSGSEAIFASLGYHYTCLGMAFGNPEKVENISLKLNSSSAFLI